MVAMVKKMKTKKWPKVNLFGHIKVEICWLVVSRAACPLMNRYSVKNKLKCLPKIDYDQNMDWLSGEKMFCCSLSVTCSKPGCDTY